MTRTDDIPQAYDERSVLLQMLHYTQDTAVAKVSGLAEDLAHHAPLPGSPLMTPVNVLNHLRWVERTWVDADLLGGEDAGPGSEQDPDANFRQGEQLTAAEAIELYERESARIRGVFADLDLDMVRRGDRAEPVTARWVLQHLIEETARHNGHLDILRELADGSTGD